MSKILSGVSARRQGRRLEKPSNREVETPGQDLLKLFSCLKPAYQDVLHDMGESEECLIDGESLVMEAFLDSRCPAAFSGSPLQLIYQIEKFLSKLLGHGGRFRVVFFSAYGLVWHHLPEVAALREVLIAHLRRTLPSYVVAVYDRWWPPWLQPCPTRTSKVTATVEALGSHDDDDDVVERSRVPEPGSDAAPRVTGFAHLLRSMRPAFVLVSTLRAELEKLRRQHCSNGEAAAQSAPDGDASPEARAVEGLEDMVACRQRLLSSRPLQIIAELSMGLLLYCLPISSVVSLSSLDLESSTRPFGFIFKSTAESLMMRAGHLSSLKAVHTLVVTDVYGNAPATAAAAAVVVVDEAEQQRIGDEVARRAAAQASVRLRGQPDALPARPLTPRAAIAAAVCRNLLLDPSCVEDDEAGRAASGGSESAGGADTSWSGTSGAKGHRRCGGGSRSDDSGATLCWLCEVYLLHAVLMDFIPLEQRALALPYGQLRALYEEHLKLAGFDGTRVPAAMAGLSADADLQGSGGAAASLDPGVARASLDMQTFLSSQVLPLLKAVVMSRVWATDTGNYDSATAGSAAAPQQLHLTPEVRTALADPYSGPFLHALVVALLVMRNEHSVRQQQRRRQADSPACQQVAQPQRRPGLQPPAPEVLLDGVRAGIPPAAVEAWLAARELAGLPRAPLLKAGLESTQAGDGDFGGGGGGGGDSGGAFRASTPGDQLLAHILQTMPYTEADAHAAATLRAALLGSGPATGDGGGSGGYHVGDGSPARLDKRAQALLLSVAQLPEAVRQNPVLRAVEELWERAAGSPAAAPPQGSSSSTDASWRPGGGVVPSPSWPSIMSTAVYGAAGTGEHTGKAPRAAAAAAVPPAGSWGPWEGLIAPLLEDRASATGGGHSGGGFDEGDIEEVYHWHTKQPLKPAFLSQADNHSAVMMRVMRSIRETPTLRLFPLFSRYIIWNMRRRVAELQAAAAEGRRTHADVRKLVEEGVQQFFQLQKMKEEAALKRLIDSLQGGVTFFRVSSSPTAALLAPGSSHPQQLSDPQQQLPLVVARLEDISSGSHLEAIRADKEGKAALAVLLRDAKMSAADLRKRLEKADSDNAATQRRMAERRDGLLQSERARWRQLVVPELLRPQGPRLPDLLDELGRFCAASTTPHELRAVAAVLALQAHFAALHSSASGAGEGGDGGGELTSAVQGALAAMLQSLADFKATCKSVGGGGGGGRALWVQPCPLLNDPRVAAPALSIACAALEALGFGDAAERLRLEAGWPDASQLLQLAEVLHARRKALAKGTTSGGSASHEGQDGQGATARGKGKAAALSGKVAGGRAATAAGRPAAAGGGGTADGLAANGDLQLVNDAMLVGYDKIKAANLGFKPLRLGVSLVRFQLRCMGDRLERLANGTPDPRVGFIPDDWQRRLLDIVDSGASAVVSAPTSSGKTFISSYVIRKVLDTYRGEGRMAIVVPTKALVLQVQAQIAKDFHDVRNLPNGMAVQGTFTRDFRQNYLSCVVLVTVPQCLEILLLSPACREWVAALKHLIFDEVQCITEPDGGEFWERSLLGTRCPFLALSATIGNPTEFTDWLRRVKGMQRVHDEAAAGGLAPGPPGAAAKKGERTATAQQRQLPPPRLQNSASYDVHLIVHRERYNDLTSSIFLPSLESIPLSRGPRVTEPTFEDADQVDWGGGGASDGDAAVGDEDQEELLPYGPGPAELAAAAAKAAAAAALAAKELPPAIHRVGEYGNQPRYEGAVLPLHPLISVDLNRVARTGKLPPEITMTPGELLQLYDGMVLQAEAVTAAAGNGRLRREASAALETAAEGVRQRLRDLDPDRLFAPLDPAPMPYIDGASDLEHGAARSGGRGGGGGGDGLPSAATGARVVASSLVLRDRVKAWEKVLLQELLRWACATKIRPHAKSASAAPEAAPTAVATAATEGAQASQLHPLHPQRRLLYGPWKECLSAISRSLASEVDRQHKAVVDAWALTHDGAAVTGWDFLYRNLHTLVRTLHRQNKLPAILFNFSRQGIEFTAISIAEHLEALQERYRQRYAGQLTAAVAAFRAAAAASRRRQGAGDQDDSDSGSADGDEGGAALAAICRTKLIDGLTFSLDSSRPDPSFSLVPLARMDDERLVNAVRELRDNPRVNPALVRALEFGVGAHHGGLNKHYRTVVEMLFRAKILQVVIAAGTLAMGVHMPCRTVVMMGDSPHLDALNYRQMSGRSGRRGLDTLGHVVFYGLPPHRVHRLRTSPMPQLQGQMLVTPTTTLRLLLLDEQLRLNAGGIGSTTSSDSGAGGSTSRGVKDAGAGAPYGSPAVDLILKITTEPFMAARHASWQPQAKPHITPCDPPKQQAMQAATGASAPHISGQQPQTHSSAVAATAGREIRGGGGGGGAAAAGVEASLLAASSPARQSRELMRHTLRLAMVQLLRNRMLDEETGRLQGLAGLATHLFWTEPANLVLCRLLQAGVFRRMCEELRGKALKEAAVALIAHIFLRIPLSPSLGVRLRSGEFAGTTSSVVQLPPLDKDAADCIRRYNRESFTAAVAYVLNYMRTQRQQKYGEAGCPTLPLSGLTIKPAGSPGVWVPAPAGDANANAMSDATDGRQPAATATAAGGGDNIDDPPTGAEHSLKDSIDKLEDADSDPRDGVGGPTQETGSCALGGNRGPDADSPLAAGGLQCMLGRMQRHLVACSPFMALGGAGDDFDSVPELLASVRQEVELQAKAIPVLELNDRYGLEQPQNAWMYDFYRNHSMTPLTRDNQIREGDVWDLVASAKGILNATALALELAAASAAASAAAARPPSGLAPSSCSPDGSTPADAASPAIEVDEEDLAAELNDENSLGRLRPAPGGGESSAGFMRAVELEHDLQQLQSLPKASTGKEAARRSALLVARLFRLVALEFSAGTRAVGA